MTIGTRAPMSISSIEVLRAELENGEINADRARERAAIVGKSGELTGDDITAIATRAQQLLLSRQWPDSVRLSILLRAAVAAADSKLARLSDSLTNQWIEIVSVALRQVPDARLYHDAMAVGNELLRTDRVSNDNRAKGMVLHSLATLNLDPWFAARSSETFRSAQADWYGREQSGETWDGAPRGSNPLPQPAEALEKAERYYRDAADVLTGESLSRTLNALTQTLLWQSRLDKKDRNEAIRETIDQALKALDPKSNPVQLAQLFSYKSKTGPADIPDAVEFWLAKPPDELVRKIGQDDTLSFYFWTADALASVAPNRALSLVQQISQVFERFADETMRDGWWRVQLRAFVQATAPGAKIEKGEGATATNDTISATLTSRLETGKRENWNESQLAAELIHLARETTKSDEEPLGIEMLDRAEAIAPLSLALFGDAISHLRSTLLVNSGATAFNAGNFAEAAGCYARALDGFFQTKSISLAGPVMSRLEDVAGKGGSDGARAALKPLMLHAMALQTLLGDDGLIGVRRICDEAISALPASPSNDDARTSLWQIAKGLQFGTFLTSGSSQRFARSENEEKVIAEIDELRVSAAAEPKMANVFQGALESEAVLLAPYSRSSIRLEGQSARERLTNLELRYEELIDERLRGLAGDEATHFITPADMRDAIDPATVLLDLLEVLGNDGQRYLHYALWTREGVAFENRSLGEAGNGFLVADGVTIPRSRMADMVQSTRSSIRLEPPTGEKTRVDAAEDLKFAGEFLLGPIWTRLTALRASGKKHLCIVPNGALHFLPFHLLTIDGKPLVDHWMVSYLPNTRMLLANRGQQTIRRHRVKGPIAVAVSFSGTEDYLAEAVPEAREVARVGKGRVFFDHDATESAFLGALRKSQMVHVASHGDFPSGAAAFQRLYLMPGDGADGLLYAHELLGLDGRGLSLVTLSACETALGRFDMGDNLRGLPANLFLAGAEAVVGTLWKVESTATSTFFQAMYKALANTATRFEAFVTAQRETRKTHPQYRDWGSFYYSGTWS